MLFTKNPDIYLLEDTLRDFDVSEELFKNFDFMLSKDELAKIFEWKNFLVIDDDYASGFLLGNYLKQVKANVDISLDFQDARKNLYEKKYDFILWEFELNHFPHLWGAAFLTELQLNPLLKDIPIVAVTADALIWEDQKYEEFWCKAYIRKLIDKKTLFEDLVKLSKKT